MTKTFLHTFLDPMKTLPQHYGAIRALANLGPNVVFLSLFIVVPLFKWQLFFYRSQPFLGPNFFKILGRSIISTQAVEMSPILSL